VRQPDDADNDVEVSILVSRILVAEHAVLWRIPVCCIGDVEAASGYTAWIACRTNCLRDAAIDYELEASLALSVEFLYEAVEDGHNDGRVPLASL